MKKSKHSAEKVIRLKVKKSRARSQHKSARISKKEPSNVLNMPVFTMEMIFQDHLMGMSKVKLAEKYDKHRDTIAKVIRVKSGDELGFVRKIRELFMGLAVAAVASIKVDIEGGNSQLGYRVLEDIGVVPRSSATAAAPLVNMNIVGSQPTPDKPLDVLREERLNAAVAMLEPEYRELFKLLDQARENAEAHGYDPATIEFPKKEQPVVVDMQVKDSGTAS